MLTEKEFVEATALYRRGWSVSAIARHLGRDRKTIRAYLRGERRPSRRRAATRDHFAVFVLYVQARLEEDLHLWGSALYDQVFALGYPRSYVTGLAFAHRAGRPVSKVAMPGSPSRPFLHSRARLAEMLDLSVDSAEEEAVASPFVVFERDQGELRRRLAALS